MARKPLVSIVIPTFNRSKFVQKAIKSSLNQTYPCEIIVCDHGSTDNTPEILKQYGNKVKYIRRENDFGPHFCWLEGILHAQGEFVHLQFDDDWVADNYVEKCLRFMKKDVGVVIAEAAGIFKFKKKFGKSGLFSSKKIEKYLLQGAMYSPGASLFRKQILIDALYQGNLPVSDFTRYHGVGPDSFMTLLAILRYKKVGIVVDHLVFFREHSGSITCNAYADPATYQRLRNAYESVSRYYLFLRWYPIVNSINSFNINSVFRNTKRVMRVVLHKLGLLEVIKKNLNLFKFFTLSSSKTH
jgi:glycosyltransferase involved in cell wall biosynthesis